MARESFTTEPIIGYLRQAEGWSGVALPQSMIGSKTYSFSFWIA